MHVVISSMYHLSSYQGGNEVYADNLARCLTEKGYAVSYLSSHAKTNGNFCYRIYRIRRFIAWFKRIDILQPDVVHTCGTGWLLSLTALYCRFKKIPVISTFQAPIKFKLAEWWDTHTFNRIIVSTPQNFHYLQQYNPTAAIEVIPLSLKKNFSQIPVTASRALSALKLNNKKKYIFTLSSHDKHHYYKGVAVALKALAHLSSEYELLIGGTGRLLSEYQKKAKQINVINRVHFLGFISDEQLPLYYAAANVFILPSISTSEGYGLVLLEAMSMGTPVITTSCVGLSSQIQEFAGIIQPNDPMALATAIKNPRTDIKKARQFANSLTIESMTQQTIEVYHKAIQHYA